MVAVTGPVAEGVVIGVSLGLTLIGASAPSGISLSSSSADGGSMSTVTQDVMQLICTQFGEDQGSLPTRSKREALAASSERASSVLGKKVKNVGVGKRTAWLRLAM